MRRIYVYVMSFCLKLEQHPLPIRLGFFLALLLHPHSPILQCQLLSFSTVFPYTYPNAVTIRPLQPTSVPGGDAHPYGWSEVASQRVPSTDSLCNHSDIREKTMWVAAGSIRGHVDSGHL